MKTEATWDNKPFPGDVGITPRANMGFAHYLSNSYEDGEANI